MSGLKVKQFSVEEERRGAGYCGIQTCSLSIGVAAVASRITQAVPATALHILKVILWVIWEAEHKQMGSQWLSPMDQYQGSLPTPGPQLEC